MGLFGKKKKETKNEETKGVGLVESVSTNNEELQDLLKEFREMRAGIRAEQQQDETEDINEEEFQDGEEYQVSEEESKSIENYLSGNDEVLEDDDLISEELEPEEEVIEEDDLTSEELEPEEEIIEEEVTAEETVEPEETEEELVEEEIAEEISEPEEIEEDFVDDELEEEIIDEEQEDDIINDETDVEEVENEEFVEPVDVDVKFNEVPMEDIPEEEIDEEIVEEDETPETDDVVEDSDYADEVVDDVYEEVETEEPIIEEQPETDGVTSEELDKKFDDFEKRLLDKIMQQFAMMQTAQVKEEPVEVKKKEKSGEEDDGELEISTVKGKLVINDYKFTGEVVMFTPIDSLRKATWEEVVRRKGHCTYHLTTSGNGGWFIKKSNAPNPYAYIEKKEDAEELAKLYAKREKAELKIHNSKGVIEQSLSFGREKLRG